jgi:hypothetical protein
MHRYPRVAVCIAGLILLLGPGPGRTPARAEEPADAGPAEAFDQQVLQWATGCRASILERLNAMIDRGEMTAARLFDTFYIPIPDTYPQKYHTRYDTAFDKTIQDILDEYLKKDRRLVFVVAVDRNGYLPTHNSRYSLPLTGNREQDILHNRTKRLFNDRTGLAAARNTRPHLLQQYHRDTGEVMFDLSVPVHIRDRHWGAVRFGYTHP